MGARKLETLKPQKVRKKVVRKPLQRRKTMKKKRRRKKKRKRRKSKCAHEDQRDFAQHSNLLTLRLHGRPDSSPVTVTSIVVTELTLIILYFGIEAMTRMDVDLKSNQKSLFCHNKKCYLRRSLQLLFLQYR